MAEEQTLFKGSPSLVIALGPLILAFLIIGASLFLAYRYSPWALILAGAALVYALLRIVLIKASYYELTNERIRMRRGIFTKRTDELELYRVKDATVVEPFLYRMFGVGNIEVTTTDTSTPNLSLKAIRGAATLRESLRQSVEACRDKKRVRLTELE
jgi:uncharacterized membrane protein YdbT with pleckstrin-like domain